MLLLSDLEDPIMDSAGKKFRCRVGPDFPVLGHIFLAKQHIVALYDSCELLDQLPMNL